MDVLIELSFQQQLLDYVNNNKPNSRNYSLLSKNKLPIEDHYFVISEDEEKFSLFYKIGKKGKIYNIDYKIDDLCFFQLEKKFNEFDIYILEKIEFGKLYLWNGFYCYDNSFVTKIHENNKNFCSKDYKIVPIRKFLKYNFVCSENFNYNEFRMEKIIKLTKRKTFNQNYISPFIKKRIVDFFKTNT